MRSACAFRARAFARAAGKDTSGAITPGALLRWVTPDSFSIMVRSSEPTFPGRAARRPEGRRAAGRCCLGITPGQHCSPSIADFSVTPSRGRNAHDVAKIGGIGRNSLRFLCDHSRDPPPPPGPKGASRWASTQKTPRSKGGEKGGKTAREARQAVNSAAASSRLAGGLLASRLPTAACLDCRIETRKTLPPSPGQEEAWEEASSRKFLLILLVSYCIG